MTTMAERSQRRTYLDRPSPSGLADVLEIILDKGLVIDIYVRVALVGIELLTIDARIVIASVDTYLRFAQAVNRLDLTQTETEGLPELINQLREGGAESETHGALEGVKDEVKDVIHRHKRGSDDEDDKDDKETSRPRTRQRRREPES
ncbi:MAG TPA: gas vesicle protein GvpJ [Streptosporangiaceae bacterium]